MNADQLLKHFDRISEAPDAIPRLREFVLDLAIRGKLLPQNTSDEPIISRLRRSIPDLATEDLEPRLGAQIAIFSETLPYGWAWLKGKLIADFLDPQPSHRTPPVHKDGVPYIGYADITEGGIIDFANARKVSPSVLEEHRQRYILKDGDFVIGKIGTIGQPFLLPSPFNYTLSANIILVQPKPDLVSSSFLMLFLNSPTAKNTLRAFQTDSTHAVFGIKKAREFPIPIPPLPEQERIVAKVDELMALCEKLESAKAEREKRRSTLVATSLHHLNNGGDAEEFRRHAGFYLNHMPDLTARAEHIQKLRQTIVSLAVQGKLVAQDPNHESASELLGRVYLEKAKSSKNWDIPIPLHSKEAPFPLPNGWEWARLGDTIQLLSGQHLQPGEYSDQPDAGPPYITGPADFGQSGLTITRYAVIRKAVASEGQILLTVKGAGVGKTTICDLPEVAISRQLMAMTAIGWSQQFLLLVTHRLAETLQESARSLIPGISRDDVNGFIFGVPPLVEQTRIVEKVDKLLAICDKLMSQLLTSRTKSNGFLEAVLHSALQPINLPALPTLAAET